MCVIMCLAGDCMEVYECMFSWGDIWKGVVWFIVPTRWTRSRSLWATMHVHRLFCRIEENYKRDRFFIATRMPADPPVGLLGVLGLASGWSACQHAKGNARELKRSSDGRGQATQLGLLQLGATSGEGCERGWTRANLGEVLDASDDATATTGRKPTYRGQLEQPLVECRRAQACVPLVVRVQDSRHECRHTSTSLGRHAHHVQARHLR